MFASEGAAMNQEKSFARIMRCVLALSLVIFAACAVTRAQSGGSYQITQSVIPGGGGTSSSGSTELTGTIGQGITGSSSGGNYTLDSGFVPLPTPTPQLPSIGGHITFNGDNLAGVTVSLSGASVATTTTDASGFYAFLNLTAGNYTVTPARTNFSFTPPARTLSLGSANVTDADFAATSTATNPQPAGGAVLISEFRLSGTTSADEFIELYNNTDAALNLGGYHLDSLAGPSITIPQDTMLAARSHYLLAHATAYTLISAAAADQTYAFDLPAHTGLALFNSAGTIVDGVGFNSTQTPYAEGNSLSAVFGLAEYAFVRKLTTGVPQDTGDNATDFALVATDGNGTLAAAQLGAPGPENTGSPVVNNQIAILLIDPTTPRMSPPNFVRNGSGNSGTLSIRRHFINQTGATITHLRFQVVDITTLNSLVLSPTQADLRLTDSMDQMVTTSLGTTLTIKGTQLEQPPNQSLGGGLNTSLSVQLPTGGLANGDSVDVQFLMNVIQNGKFRFFFNVEALP
jgi:hypothetical protein